MAFSLRQPGSALKPFLYALAFEQGFAPETIILDEKVQFKTAEGHPYEPKNYDLQYHGQVTLREALAQSLNIPAVKILGKMEVNNYLNFLRKCGFSTLNSSSEYYGLALALGTGEISLFELTKAYSVFPNKGQLVDFFGIQSVCDQNNQCLLSNNSRSNYYKEVISSYISSQITSILSDNFSRIPAFGEDNPLKFDYSVAAKTGTSRNFRDNWTVGYSSKFTLGTIT